MTDTDDLRRLPNVGDVLARELRAAGIATARQLRELGAPAAWERVRRVNPDRDCASSLLALEGAVRGVRWMAIDPAERRRLSADAGARRGR
jgi:DNA transformation protein